MAYVKMYSPNVSNEEYALGVALLSFSFLLRNFRLSVLLGEVKAFNIIQEMVMKMTVPIMYQLACLYIIFYIFAIVGIYGLGGLIK